MSTKSLKDDVCAKQKVHAYNTSLHACIAMHYDCLQRRSLFFALLHVHCAKQIFFFNSAKSMDSVVSNRLQCAGKLAIASEPYLSRAGQSWETTARQSQSIFSALLLTQSRAVLEQSRALQGNQVQPCQMAPQRIVSSTLQFDRKTGKFLMNAVLTPFLLSRAEKVPNN